MYLQNSVASYIPTNLDYYEEYYSTIAFSGAWSQSITVSFTAIGNTYRMVTCSFQTSLTATTISSNTLHNSTAFPARFRPGFATKSFTVWGRDKDLETEILVNVSTGGVFTMGPYPTGASTEQTPANFGAGTTNSAAVYATAFSWLAGS